MSDRHTYRLRFAALLVLTAAAFAFGALVVPRILNSHIVAGENAAIAALINLSEAENAYRDRYREIGFTPITSLAAVGGKYCIPSSDQACMVDPNLARSNGKPFRGYLFLDITEDATPRATYTIVAVPVKHGQTGLRSFCVIEKGVPRYRDLGHDAFPQQITREQCLRDFTPLP